MKRSATIILGLLLAACSASGDTCEAFTDWARTQYANNPNAVSSQDFPPAIKTEFDTRKAALEGKCA